MTHCGEFVVQRTSDEVFDLLANPERFAPLLPDFESMAIRDVTHFTLRIVIAVGQIGGHANLAMELYQIVRPTRVGYRGEGIIAGGNLRMSVDFAIAETGSAVQVHWHGAVTLDDRLGMMAGSLLESMAKRNFERMAERLQNGLHPAAPAAAAVAPAPPENDYEI